MTPRAAPWWLPALGVFLVGYGLSLVQPWVAMHRDIRLEAMRSLVDLDRTYMGDPLPAIEVARRLALDPRAPVYQGDLSTGSAFIYPPIAALPYRPLAFLPPDLARDRLALADHLLLAIIVALVVRLADRRRGAGPWALAAWVVACASFYPLAHAVELNQAALFVSACVGAAWVGLDEKRPALAGVALALAMAVKPQLALVLPLLLWHAPRMVASAAAAGATLAVASLVYAGADAHVDYVTRVLPSLSRGYAYYANQGLNGFLQRLVGGVDITVLRQPPRSTLVTGLTMASAVAVLGGAAAAIRRWRAVEPVWAFAIAWLATTITSPVAWQHHYVPALFAFALVARALRAEPALRRARFVLPAAVGFTLMASYFEVRMLQGVVPRLMASYVLYGAFSLGVCVALLAEETSARLRTTNRPISVSDR